VKLGKPKGQTAIKPFNDEICSMTDEQLKSAKIKHSLVQQTPGDESYLMKSLAFEAECIRRFGIGWNLKG
jgi:hypothetical protein